MNHCAERRVGVHDLREASGLPVSVKGLANAKPSLLTAQVCIDAFRRKVLGERKREQFPDEGTTSHSGTHFARQHASRRTGQVDAHVLGSHQAVCERLPPPGHLNLVKEAVQALTALLFGVKTEVGLGEEIQIALPNLVKTVVEKVDAEDVLDCNAPVKKCGDHLVQERGLAAASGADTDKSLPRYQPIVEMARHTGESCLSLGLQQHVLYGLDRTHGAIMDNPASNFNLNRSLFLPF